MQITLLGHPYEVGDVTHDAPVGYVRQLKKISGGKVTVKTIRDELGAIAQNLKPEEGIEVELLDDDAFLDNFQGMIWLVGRTYAGLDWSWDDAGAEANVDMLLSLSDEPEEAVEEEDPKAHSVPGEGANPTS